jgi:hypothetical protein
VCVQGQWTNGNVRCTRRGLHLAEPPSPKCTRACRFDTYDADSPDARPFLLKKVEAGSVSDAGQSSNISTSSNAIGTSTQLSAGGGWDRWKLADNTTGMNETAASYHTSSMLHTLQVWEICLPTCEQHAFPNC